MEEILHREHTEIRLASLKPKKVGNHIEMGMSASGFIKNLINGVYEEPISLLCDAYPSLPREVARAIIKEGHAYTVTEDDTVVIEWSSKR